MARIAIIGGTGLSSLPGLTITHREMIETPFGPPSSPLILGEIGNTEIVFLARHGGGHTIPPHQINYRANLWAIKESGANKIVAVAAVGGIRNDMLPGQLVFPDQIIDYTYSRKNTFYEDRQAVKHIDFTYPYSDEIRGMLIAGARKTTVDSVSDGTYAATQGPRLETAAEILRLEKDGCDIVGMTGMPEASLARELSLEYACCAVVANWAAGKSEGIITMEDIDVNLKKGMARVQLLLEQVIAQL